MPAAASAASTASAGAMLRSAPRSALRRWANAASTTAKTCSRVAVVRRRLVVVHATRPESTLGAGQKTLRPIGAGPAYVGVPGGLDRRDAVHLGAGRGREPVGDLGLHHHQPVLERGQQREQVQQHRHRHVVGQVGDQRSRRRAGQRRRPAARRRAPPRTGRPGPGRTSRSSPAAASRASRRARSRPPGRRPRAGRGSASRAPARPRER